MSLDDILTAYAGQFPDEGLPVRCAAVVCDGTGRVLQRKTEGTWQFPMSEGAQPEDAAAALANQMGITAAAVEDEPIDVAVRGNSLVVSYVCTIGQPVPAAVAVSARWSPYDTILNERLGTKLALRNP